MSHFTKNSCKEAKEAIRLGNTDAVAGHIAGCDDCRMYLDNQSVLGRTPIAPMSEASISDLFGAVEQQTQQDTVVHRKLSQLPTLYRFVGVGITAIAILLFVFFFNQRIDWFVYPTMRLLAEASILGLVLLAHLWLLIRPMHLSPLKKWKRAGLLLTTIGIVAAPLVLPAAHHDHPESLHGIGDDLFARAAACFAWGSVLGAVLGGIAWQFLRKSKQFSSQQGALLLAGATLALLSLHLHCPIVHPLHIALGHTSIVIGVWFIVAVKQLRR